MDSNWQNFTIKIAIDGPAGAGKTTISKKIAEHLNYRYIDTGAMFRAMAKKCLDNGVDPKDKIEVPRLLENTKIEVTYDDEGRQIVHLDGEDVSEKIRTVEIGKAASDVGTVPEVRKYLLDLQRDIAKVHNVVMDGRDVGTVVLPHADIKIFLTASTEDRATRRHKELLSKGQFATFEDVMKDLKYRDRNDASREIAPLKVANDAIIVDTTDIGLEQSIAVLKEIVGDKIYDISRSYQEHC
ncbi:MAG: (d)CMP kinase [Oscillospiraceae bacterium]|nr:(d)CMP kinase [Oscillospiraceae bacterium]